MEEERKRKGQAYLVEAKAEVQGKGNPYTGLQSPSQKSPHNNEQGLQSLSNCELVI